MFFAAFVFNQDVSKWNTGAVTVMRASKCTLSPSLWPRLPLLCILNIRQLEFHRITILTRFVIFVSFVVSPSLAVFDRAFVFNQDVSKWNTGAVTSMGFSKCINSMSLSVATLSIVVFLNI